MTGARDDECVAQSSDRGFALVVVIWGLGLLTLICLTVVSTSRYRLSATRNVVGASQAAHLAEAGTQLAILSMMRNGGAALDGSPSFCSLPLNAKAVITIEDEGGKVDLNAAMPPLLVDTFKGLGIDREKADAIAKAIIEYRMPSASSVDPLQKAYEAAGRMYGPKHGLFQTPLELDQVPGIDASIFNAVMPYFTVSSQQPNVDPRTAAPALFAALAGAPLADVQALARSPYPNALKRDGAAWARISPQGAPSGVVTVHVEVLLPNGSLATQRTLVDLRAGGNTGFAIKEIRRAGAIYQDRLRDLARLKGSIPLSPC